MKRLFARLGFTLLLMSVLFIKYYPALGRGYDSWTGAPVLTGVTTNKNSLGCLCLVLGLSTLWLFIESFRENSRRAQKIVVHGTMLGTVLWLLMTADSATSLACFLVGSMLILALHRRKAEKRARLIHLAFGAVPVVVFVVFVVFDAQAYLLEAMGRDATLTGRTELWQTLIEMDVSPWLGAGYESFFLGDRLDFLWSKYWWHPNQAHNGYLEIYLTLGWIGIGLFAALIISGYRAITRTYSQDPGLASLRLAFWLTFLIYDLTEAAVKVINPVWIVFLFAVATVPAALERASTVDAKAPKALSRDTSRWRRARPSASWV